ncbi:hypothetical protein H5410_061049, partial [Solanum commersonii]
MFHLEEGVCNKETKKQQLWQEGGQKVQQIVGGLVGNDDRASNGANGGKANCYTIYKQKKVSIDPAEESTSDPYKLNHKYQKRLYGWLAKKRYFYYHKSKQYRSIVKVRKYVFKDLSKLEIDQKATEVKKGGVVETCSMKRKDECSILKRESTIKKHKSKNSDQSKVKKFLVDTRNNLIGIGIGHHEVHGFDNKFWEALLETMVMEQVK